MATCECQTKRTSKRTDDANEVRQLVRRYQKKQNGKHLANWVQETLFEYYKRAEQHSTGIKSFKYNQTTVSYIPSREIFNIICFAGNPLTDYSFAFALGPFLHTQFGVYTLSKLYETLLLADVDFKYLASRLTQVILLTMKERGR